MSRNKQQFCEEEVLERTRRGEGGIYAFKKFGLASGIRRPFRRPQCPHLLCLTRDNRLCVSARGEGRSYHLLFACFVWGFVFIPHSFEPSFFSKSSRFPWVSGGFPERRIPGENGEGAPRGLSSSGSSLPPGRPYGLVPSVGRAGWPGVER